MTQGGRSSAFYSLGGWASFRAQGGAFESDFEAHAFRVLQIGNDPEQVAKDSAPGEPRDGERHPMHGFPCGQLVPHLW